MKTKNKKTHVAKQNSNKPAAPDFLVAPGQSPPRHPRTMRTQLPRGRRIRRSGREAAGARGTRRGGSGFVGLDDTHLAGRASRGWRVGWLVGWVGEEGAWGLLKTVFS